MTGPGVLVDRLAYVGSYRIEVDVSEQFKEMAVFFNKYAFAAATEQLAVNLSAAVETLSIDSVDMAHGS